MFSYIYSVDERNEQRTANGTQIAPDHMVSSAEMTAVIDSSMKKKRTMDADMLVDLLNTIFGPSVD
ncbi:hypothetical protein ANCCAN_09644 [Ancylostoma caninum]|uniref:Uncharacterized protein n=1 Tax=Ancylostoma caninum TaxID=29170 RepID=A0A368GN71_ANCCA|nr:hypothetical protein ANCCAN_09644 [Ancylostoma caninum]